MDQELQRRKRPKHLALNATSRTIGLEVAAYNEARATGLI